MSAAGRESIDLLLARWVLGRLAPKDVSHLAVQALERGRDSPVVAVLAGVRDAGRGDVEDELPALLRDLGRDRPSELQALKTLVDDCAARIVEGDIERVAGAVHISALWSEHVADADKEPLVWTDVRAFVGLASECDNPGQHVAEYVADIVEQSRALLARGGLNIGEGDDSTVLRWRPRGRSSTTACGWHAVSESLDCDRGLSFLAVERR